MKRMKIAYNLPSLYIPGGMERVLVMKADYLVRNGCEVHIILTDGADKPSYYPLNPAVVVHQLDINFDEDNGSSFLKRVWMYRRKMRIIKRRLDECLCGIRPDITVSMLRRDINLLNAMKDGSLKIGEMHICRAYFRNFHAPFLPAPVYGFIRKRWIDAALRELRQFSKFVLLSEEDAAAWKELDNTVVIPNPVSFFPESVSDCSFKQVIAVGRYTGQKGFDKLIAAWQKVAVLHPDWVLKIYGDGFLRESLQRQIERLGVADSCMLERPTADIAGKYQESSIFVLSSVYEGFGLVIVEAMSCGLPVVSFACPCGPRDIITDGKDGFLVAAGDVDGLAAKMDELISDDELRRKMGHAARLKSENYQMERIGPMWLDLFNELLRQRDK